MMMREAKGWLVGGSSAQRPLSLERESESRESRVIAAWMASGGRGRLREDSPRGDLGWKGGRAAKWSIGIFAAQSATSVKSDLKI